MPEPARRRIFLLSPARAGGARSRLLLRPEAAFDLAVRLRVGGAPLGDAFAFVSGLYFRGKLAYARAFASPPQGIPGSYVIVAGRGLVPPETLVTVEDLLAISSVPIHLRHEGYRLPLEQACRALADAAGPDCDYILLGSVATLKYLEPMHAVFGDRLLFPVEFVGRGDMSRGGLLLRSARSGTELSYAPAGNLARHGQRPPRLPRLRRSGGRDPVAGVPSRAPGSGQEPGP
jgi:hypothetical protein